MTESVQPLALSSELGLPKSSWLRGAAELGLVFVAALLSRIPFLDAGYGLDPDANRVVTTARAIAATGTYTASRLPGYPVQEFVTAAAVSGGPRAINGLTALCSALATALLALSLRMLGIRDAWLMAAGFASVPVIYINSTCALDYVWALMFVLAALCFAQRNSAWPAGVCLGLAIGTRITSGAMLLPLALVLAASSESFRMWLKQSIKLGVSACAIGALCYGPVLARHGLKFFTYSEGVGGGSALAIWRRASLGVWGALGCVALGWAVVSIVATPKKARPMLARAQRLWLSAACSSAALLYAIAFLVLPHEAGYLVPVVPFLILLATLWIGRPHRCVMALLLMAAPFVGYRNGAFTREGAVLADYRERAQREQGTQDILRAVEQLPRPAIIVAGYLLPGIEVAQRNPNAKHRYIYLLKNPAQVEGFRSDNYDIYFVNRAIEAYQAKAKPLALKGPKIPILPR